MPAGGGSAGGGGGYGGGGYHGGGYYGGGYYGRGRGCSPYGWTVTIIIILVVGTICGLIIPLSVSTEPVTTRRYTEVYGLTDNLIYPFKGDFCQDLRATSTNVPNRGQTTASLSFLSSRPPLTNRESFSLSRSPSLDSFNNYRSWNFVLNAGSNSSFVVCYEDVETRYDVIFNLIRGVRNFQEWVKTVKSHHTIRSVPLNEGCQTFTYNVTIDANYYFVFYLPSNRQTNLNISFEFDRTLYNLSSDLVVKNCSFPLDGESSCSLGIPISSGYLTFVSFNTTLPVDYDDGAYIHFTCTPRGWLYAVIVLVVLFVSVIILVSVILFCVKVMGVTFKRCKCSPTTTTVVAAGSTTNEYDDSRKLATESSFNKPPSSSYPTQQYGSAPNNPPPPYDF